MNIVISILDGVKIDSVNQEFENFLPTRAIVFNLFVKGHINN